MIRISLTTSSFLLRLRRGIFFRATWKGIGDHGLGKFCRRAQWPRGECFWNDGAGLCQTALWPCAQTPELRKQQDNNWFLHLLGCHLPETFCLLNPGIISLNYHPQISDNILHPHSSPMASVYHLCYHSHKFCKQDFVTVKINQNRWESFSNSMGFGHFFIICITKQTHAHMMDKIPP